MQCHEKEGQGKMTIYVVFMTFAYMFFWYDRQNSCGRGEERLTFGAFKKKCLIYDKKNSSWEYVSLISALHTNHKLDTASKLQFSSKCLCIGWLSSFNKFWRVSYMKFHTILLKINFDFQFLLRFFHRRGFFDVVVFLLFLLTLDHTELSTRLSTNLGWASGSLVSHSQSEPLSSGESATFRNVL